MSVQITKIFLASSSELKEDREQFEIFINRKNKEYIKQSIFLELVIWEDFLDVMSATRLQDEYNKAITECHIFVSLFKTKVGQYTEEEFDHAFGTFKENNRPLIYTYFKDSPINLSVITSEINSLLKFKDKIDKLGHFYTQYKNIDDLKFKFSQQLNKLIKNLTPIDEKVQFGNPEEILSETKTLDQKLAQIPEKIKSSFQEELAKKIIDEAKQEVEKVYSGNYKIDVGKEKNFLVRAKSIFENATQIYAFSVDKISSFWLDPKNQGLTRSYISSQPKNTVRLFVFSSALEAHKYLEILNFHHIVYGEEGRVYICSIENYKKLLKQFYYIGEIDKYYSADFGILFYQDLSEINVIEANLNKNSLEFHFIDLNKPDIINHKSLIAQLDELKILDFQDFSDQRLETSFCIKRWNPESMRNRLLWQKELEILFTERKNGKVYHCVLFKARNEKLKYTIWEIKNDIAHRLEEFGVKTIWFGENPPSTLLHDSKYQGKLEINTDYNYLLLLEFETIEKLNKYYQDVNHSELRSKLYRDMDDRLNFMYQSLEDESEQTKKTSIFSIIEEISSKYMMRCDFVYMEHLKDIVNDIPYPFPFKI